ncbi:MAG: response regulator [Rhodospirillaceae bacterium]|nr:MAG: response regulator [Rhodospirillaceae bacterium]
MAKILLVDDRAMNRRFLKTLLEAFKHQTIEAADGEEALRIVRDTKPDLVISDIVMPKMDGFDLAKRINVDPDLKHIVVIFYTATYRQAGLKRFANECGVKYVIAKPSEPQVILDVVAKALGETSAAPSVAAPRVRPTNQLDASYLETVTDLTAVAMRLTTMVELGIDLTLERELRPLLRKLVHATQDIVNAPYVGVGVLSDDGLTFDHFETIGIDSEIIETGRAWPVSGSAAVKAVLAGDVVHQVGLKDAGAVGLPQSHPPVECIIMAPVRTLDAIAGWLYLARRPGEKPFGEEDVRVASKLALILASTYENARLYEEIQLHAEEMRDQIGRREKAEHALRASEAALHESMKMEALGHLTGGVAHDFNNMLAVVRTNAEDLIEDLKDTPHYDQAEMILHAATRGAETVAQLMAFSRKQELMPKTIDLNARLDPFARLLRRAIPENISIEIIKDGNLSPITVDPGRLENAILNLAINARDATPGSGTITIRTQAATLSLVDVDGRDGMEAGPHVMISVADTGTGMTPEIIKRVFEPFFTTKEVGKGTGLGLSMVFGFAKQCGGDVRIESEPGHGTTMTIVLPLVARDIRNDSKPVKTAATPAKPSATPARSGPTIAGKILVVEDDDLVRQSVTAKLKRLGLSVTTAISARDAIATLERSADFDLVMSDVIMPGDMSGADLIREMAVRWPTIRPLLTSGYTENNLLGKIKMPPSVRLLSKPYSNADLATAIRETMGKSIATR